VRTTDVRRLLMLEGSRISRCTLLGVLEWSTDPTRGTGELPRGETIPWRVIAAQLAPRERRGPR